LTRAQKIIYVLGLGHSGSTVLDMLLTTGGKAVGLGQVWTVLREDFAISKERICSCGAPALNCAMWGPVLEQTASLSQDVPPWSRYQLILDRAAHLYGPEITIVDSSKLVENLSLLVHCFPDVGLHVIHNIKDVRSFTISMLDNSRRKARGRELPEKIFYRWYRDNRRAYEQASALLGRPPTGVMYEGLCLAPEAMTERLREALGEQHIDLQAALNSGYTHIISGNRSRLLESGRADTLAYDYQWLARREWLRPYLVMTMVRSYNERCLREFGGLNWASAPRQLPSRSKLRAALDAEDSSTGDG
jgi:hypothetical protein